MGFRCIYFRVVLEGCGSCLGFKIKEIIFRWVKNNSGFIKKGYE